MKSKVIFSVLLPFIFSYFIITQIHALELDSPRIEVVDNVERYGYKFDDTKSIVLSGSSLEIYSNGNIGVFSDEVVMPNEIILTEPEAGLLKKGTNIYLSVDDRKFCEFVGKEIIEGDIEVDCEITTEGYLKISVVKESTEPSKFRVIHIAVNMQEDKELLNRQPVGKAEGVYYSYPLLLLSDENLKDNLFATLEDDMILNSSFTVLKDWVMEPSRIRYAGVRMVVEKDSITRNNVSYPLSNHCYLNKDGYYMIPLREVLFKVNKLDEVYWDDKTQSTSIPYVGSTKGITVAANSTSSLKNGEEYQLITPAEIKNGVMYISFRDFINLSGNTFLNDFYWDKDRLTVSFKLKG